MASKTPFQYTPLNLDRPALRLVHLKAATDDPTKHPALLIDPIIECELIEAFYDVDFVPDYEAVSYTWGDANNTRKISLDGSGFSVTHNLWSLLHDLRYQSEDRVLWIDAICIDQGNHRERGHQVQQMDQIYRHAERVIIWLGPLTVSIGILLDSLAQLQQDMEGLSWSSTDYRWEFNWGQVLMRLHVDNATLKSALRQVMERPWWCRAWILQEVANARAAIVYCGFKSVSGKIFSVCPHLLHLGLDSHCQAVIDVMPGPLRRDSWWSRERDFSMLLTKFSRTQATREHDRIFALLGLCPEANAQISTDYDKSIAVVVRETVSFIFACNISRLPTINTVEGLLEAITTGTIHNTVFEDLLRYSDISTLKEFIAKHAKKLTRTSNVCAAAASNENHGEFIWRAVLNLGVGLPLPFELNTLLRPFIDSGNDTAIGLYIEYISAYNIDFTRLVDKLLIKAAEFGQEKAVTLLLSKGADLSYKKMGFGVTALMAASSKGHEMVVRLLLDKIDPEAKGQSCETALLDATKNGHIGVVQALLENGADCNNRNSRDDDTAILIASKTQQADILQLLLDNGADCEVRDMEDKTPIFVASEMGSVDIVQLLLDYGADYYTECRERTPMTAAMERGNGDVLRLLLHRECRDLGLSSGFWECEALQ
ncbi:heterokaryon incompatibility protein-domain-containing protein [Apiospora marii]|uniref:Heterokaryon incompatibility protein-domain-containing protein n=1 Tax=Apiospora marii TaxID=335849 RepID=A0ABR1RN56_9PEZI